MFSGIHTAVFVLGYLISGGFGDEFSTELCAMQDGVFPIPDDCSSFARCQSGSPEIQMCPEGLLYNPFRLTCDFSTTGSCTDSSDFDSTAMFVETSDIVCPLDGPNIYAIESSCSEYYVCVNDTAYLAECPSSLLMNRYNLTCDFSQNVNCDISRTEDSTGFTAIFESKNEEPEERIADESETSTNVFDTGLEETTTQMSVTEYTSNKQPTVVTESTAQTQEGMNMFTETTVNPEAMGENAPNETNSAEQPTDENVPLPTFSDERMQTTSSTQSVKPNAAKTTPEELVTAPKDGATTRSMKEIVTSKADTETSREDTTTSKVDPTTNEIETSSSSNAIDITSSDTEITEPESATIEETMSSIKTSSDISANDLSPSSLQDFDSSEVLTEANSSPELNSTFVNSNTDEIISDPLTDTNSIDFIYNTTNESTTNSNNFPLTTIKPVYTTLIQTDSNISPEKTLSTTQTLMSSDPLTDNETLELRTYDMTNTADVEELTQSPATIIPTEKFTPNDSSNDGIEKTDSTPEINRDNQTEVFTTLLNEDSNADFSTLFTDTLNENFSDQTTNISPSSTFTETTPDSTPTKVTSAMESPSTENVITREDTDETSASGDGDFTTSSLQAEGTTLSVSENFTEISVNVNDTTLTSQTPDDNFIHSMSQETTLDSTLTSETSSESTVLEMLTTKIQVINTETDLPVVTTEETGDISSVEFSKHTSSDLLSTISAADIFTGTSTNTNDNTSESTSSLSESQTTNEDSISGMSHQTPSDSTLSETETSTSIEKTNTEKLEPLFETTAFETLTPDILINTTDVADQNVSEINTENDIDSSSVEPALSTSDELLMDPSTVSAITTEAPVYTKDLTESTLSPSITQTNEILTFTDPFDIETSTKAQISSETTSNSIITTDFREPFSHEVITTEGTTENSLVERNNTSHSSLVGSTTLLISETVTETNLNSNDFVSENTSGSLVSETSSTSDETSSNSTSTEAATPMISETSSERSSLETLATENGMTVTGATEFSTETQEDSTFEESTTGHVPISDVTETSVKNKLTTSEGETSSLQHENLASSSFTTEFTTSSTTDIATANEFPSEDSLDTTLSQATNESPATNASQVLSSNSVEETSMMTSEISSDASTSETLTTTNSEKTFTDTTKAPVTVMTTKGESDIDSSTEHATVSTFLTESTTLSTAENFTDFLPNTNDSYSDGTLSSSFTQTTKETSTPSLFIDTFSDSTFSEEPSTVTPEIFSASSTLDILTTKNENTMESSTNDDITAEEGTDEHSSTNPETVTSSSVLMDSSSPTLITETETDVTTKDSSSDDTSTSSISHQTFPYSTLNEEISTKAVITLTPETQTGASSFETLITRNEIAISDVTEPSEKEPMTTEKSIDEISSVEPFSFTSNNWVTESTIQSTVDIAGQTSSETSVFTSDIPLDSTEYQTEDISTSTMSHDAFSDSTSTEEINTVTPETLSEGTTFEALTTKNKVTVTDVTETSVKEDITMEDTNETSEYKPASISETSISTNDFTSEGTFGSSFTQTTSEPTSSMAYETASDSTSIEVTSRLTPETSLKEDITDEDTNRTTFSPAEFTKFTSSGMPTETAPVSMPEVFTETVVSTNAFTTEGTSGLSFAETSEIPTSSTFYQTSSDSTSAEGLMTSEKLSSEAQSTVTPQALSESTIVESLATSEIPITVETTVTEDFTKGKSTEETSIVLANFTSNNSLTESIPTSTSDFYTETSENTNYVSSEGTSGSSASLTGEDSTSSLYDQSSSDFTSTEKTSLETLETSAISTTNITELSTKPLITEEDTNETSDAFTETSINDDFISKNTLTEPSTHENITQEDSDETSSNGLANLMSSNMIAESTTVSISDIFTETSVEDFPSEDTSVSQTGFSTFYSTISDSTSTEGISTIAPVVPHETTTSTRGNTTLTDATEFSTKEAASTHEDTDKTSDIFTETAFTNEYMLSSSVRPSNEVITSELPFQTLPETSSSRIESTMTPETSYTETSTYHDFNTTDSRETEETVSTASESNEIPYTTITLTTSDIPTTSETDVPSKYTMDLKTTLNQTPEIRSTDISTNAVSTEVSDVTETATISSEIDSTINNMVSTEEPLELETTSEISSKSEVSTAQSYIISTDASSGIQTAETAITTTVSSGSAHTLNSVCETPEGFYPNPNDCSTFYTCINGVPIEASCIENEHFNPVTMICEDPCKAKCDLNTNCPTDESTTSSVVTTSDTTRELSSTYTPDSDFTETEERTESTPQEFQTETTEGARIPTDVTELTTIPANPDTSPPDDFSLSEYPETESTYPTVVSTEVTTTGETSDTTDVSTTEGYLDFSTTYHPSSPLEDKTSSHVTTSTDSEAKTIPALSTTADTSDLQTIITARTFITGSTTNLDDATLEIGTSTTLFSTSYISSDETTESKFDQTISTHITTSDCSGKDCLPSEVPITQTPIPYSICHRNDFLPQPSCNKYLDCTEKIPIQMECPVGLHFNPTTRVCDWPFKAECGKIAEPLYKPDDSYECPRKSCLVPSTSSCSEYYLCLGYTAYHLNCSSNLLFDKRLNTCTYEPLADCTLSPSTRPATSSTTEKATHSTTKSSTSKSPTTPSTTSRKATYSTTKSSTTTRPTLPSTTKKPERFRCPIREGLFRHPGSCAKFYQCANWHPYEMRCAAFTHFSVITKRCEYPCDAKCDTSLNCGKVETYTPSGSRCPCKNCKLPSSETCEQYILCVDGRARIEKCPWGQTYDDNKKICDWAHKVSCRRNGMCPEQNGMFPHAEDCHKFVHCSNGIHHVKSCPSVLEFDPVKKRCDWPAGRCSHSPIPKEFEVFNRDERREGWKCPRSFGQFSDVDNCNKFYHCTYGIPSLKECSDGLLYNHRSQTCDWKEQVRCDSNRHHTPRRCRVYDRNVFCSDDRKPLSHKLCNMYYDCTAGRACAKQCPVGLYFNKATGMCDLPQNAKCFNPYKEDYSLKEFSEECEHHSHGRKPNPADAACFYHCRHGKVVAGCCPRGHIYNIHRDKCERRT